MVRQFLREMKLGIPSDRYFKLGILATVMQGLSAVALLGVSAWLISRSAEVTSIVYLGLSIVGVRGFAVGRAAFRYAERLLLHESAFRMLSGRRSEIFSKLIPFVPAGIARFGRGETVSLVVNDVDELQNLPLRVIAPLVQSVVVTIASIAFLTWLLPSMGLIITLLAACSFLIAIPIAGHFAKASDRDIAPLKATLAEQNLDVLENQEIYLAYGWLPERRSEMAKTDAMLKRALAKSATSNGLGAGLLTALSSVGVLCGAILGGHAVLDGELPGATLAIFALLPLAVFEILQGAQPAASAFRKYRVSARRVAKLLDERLPNSLSFELGESELEAFDSLELRDASVQYPHAAHSAVTQINLQVLPGESVLISGASGVGKTTLALVLTRLLQPSAGQYLINGLPAGFFSVESVRRVVGLVEQNPMIFLGDVRANLSLAKPEADDSQLQEVLETVGLWPMFSAREGLDTQLGDRGVLISGGEAQRLGLARALLADFKVLILDEPTSNVDTAMSDQLMRDLLRIATRQKRRAVILISHERQNSYLVDREVQLPN